MDVGVSATHAKNLLSQNHQEQCNPISRHKQTIPKIYYKRYTMVVEKNRLSDSFRAEGKAGTHIGRGKVSMKVENSVEMKEVKNSCFGYGLDGVQ